MEKAILKNYLKEGLTNREIAKITGKSKSTIGYWVKQYELQDFLKYNKPNYSDVDYFSKVDTKEKAYILGFILGDGCLTENELEVTVALSDKVVLDFIKNQINCNIHVDDILNKKKKRYPRARVNIGNKTIIKDLSRLFGGYKKEDRHIPFISPKLERYLLQGFFDAEGCVTWGRRKDRNRVWHKISFTSQYNMLDSIQNILLKNGISTKLRPKSGGEKCYVIEFATREDVLHFLEIIYPDDDFIVLQRKYNNAQALRLELGEFGES